MGLLPLTTLNGRDAEVAGVQREENCDKQMEQMGAGHAEDVLTQKLFSLRLNSVTLRMCHIQTRVHGNVLDLFFSVRCDTCY